MQKYIADELGLPPKRVMWFLSTLSALILIGGVWLYEAKTYPHGPKYFTGEWDLVEGERTGGGMVPIYEEDTSQLNNPTWVTFFRNIEIVFLIATLGLGIAALVHGNKLVEHFRIRRKLLILDDRLRRILAHRGPSLDLLYNLFWTNVWVRRWTASGDFLQRAMDLDDPPSDDFFDSLHEDLRSSSNSLEEINWPTKRNVENLIRDTYPPWRWDRIG